MTLHELEEPEWATLIEEPALPAEARYIAANQTQVLATLPRHTIRAIKVTHRGTVGDPATYGKVDHVTCHARCRRNGVPTVCGAQIALPGDGGLPVECPYGHKQPWYGTLEPTPGPVR